ncbi:hypothetical protein EKO27_g7490 [Xylaria grammica]|uniref:Uncharacterized protein n=1 Tax=Xylaria grammica TaxID=363999 RepID=A0A439D003_9PEZI|nr:hypothetical protein EKO27_g7490 [Xylaria grammica]
MQQQNTSSRSGHFTAPKRKRADTSNSTEPTSTNNKRQCLANSLCPSSSDDAKVLSAIDARYEVQLQSVISSSKIKQRVLAMLRHLTPPPTSSTIEPTTNMVISKTRISVLRAKATEASKLISIAEIAKREIERERLSSDGAVSEAEQRSIIGCPDEPGHDEDDEFEVMKTPFERAIEGRPLVRGVPVMSLFLSRSSIEELKRRYGEQTNTPST